jgi:hypothetical protein
MHLDTKQAAAYLEGRGIAFKPGTLVLWRRQGRGPLFKRVAGKVFYEQGTLDRFIQGM